MLTFRLGITFQHRLASQLKQSALVNCHVKVHVFVFVKVFIFCSRDCILLNKDES